jgi:hypothetical protein
MSIGKQLAEQLARLASGESVLASVPSSDSAYMRIVALEGPLQASLELFDYDRYSVTLRELTIGTGGAAPNDARAYMSAAAAEVARHLSFLEEPLAVWELDGGERLAQLRSSPPRREGDEVSYWEVTLWAPSTSSGQGGDQPGARAVRYRWAPGMPEREAVAYPATFALVARMADSLAEALRADEP